MMKKMGDMEKYSEKQIEYYREHWDPQGVHLSRSETIERMEAAGIEPKKIKIGNLDEYLAALAKINPEYDEVLDDDIV